MTINTNDFCNVLNLNYFFLEHIRISKNGTSQDRIDPQPYDKALFQARHLIENFFAKLKQYRAIATRYDKTARNFPDLCQLV